MGQKLPTASPSRSEFTALNDQIASSSINVTLKSGFSIRSWGSISAYKAGNIVILTFTGLASDSNVTNDVPFCTLTGVTSKGTITGTGMCNSHVAFLQIITNSSEARIGNLDAGAACYGQLVFAAN